MHSLLNPSIWWLTAITMGCLWKPLKVSSKHLGAGNVYGELFNEPYFKEGFSAVNEILIIQSHLLKKKKKRKRLCKEMQSSSKGGTVLLTALSPKLYSIWYLPRVRGMKPQAYQLLLRLQITPFIYMDIFTWKKFLLIQEMIICI